MLNKGKQLSFLQAIAAWAIVTLVSQSLLGMTHISYDSGGVLSLIWWGVQLIAVPVHVTAEFLSLVGMKVSGHIEFMILTVAIAALLCVAVIVFRK